MEGKGRKVNKEKWLACTVLLCYVSSRLLTILTLGGGDELKCNWVRRAIIGQTLKLCVALATEFEGLCK